MNNLSLIDFIDSFVLLNIFKYRTDSIAILRLVCQSFNVLLICQKGLLFDYFDDICKGRPNAVCTNSVTKWMLDLPNCELLKKNLYQFYEPIYDDDSLINQLIIWGDKKSLQSSNSSKINYSHLFHKCIKLASSKSSIKSLLCLVKSPKVSFKHHLVEFLQYSSHFLNFKGQKIYLKINQANFGVFDTERIRFCQFRKIFQSSTNFYQFQDTVHCLIKIDQINFRSKAVDKILIQKIILYGVIEHHKPLIYLQWVEQNFKIFKNVKFFLKCLARCNNETGEYIINKWPRPKIISYDDEYYLAHATKQIDSQVLFKFVNLYKTLQKSVQFLISLLMVNGNKNSENFIKLYLDQYHFSTKELSAVIIELNFSNDLWLIKHLCEFTTKIVPHITFNGRGCYHNFATFIYYIKNIGFSNISWYDFGNLDDLDEEFLNFYIYVTPLVYPNVNLSTNLGNFVAFLARSLSNPNLLTVDQLHFCFKIIKAEKMEATLISQMGSVADEFEQSFLEVFHRSMYILHINKIYTFNFPFPKTYCKSWKRWVNLFINSTSFI